jgi:DNA-binding transcriptional LysR family regulator
MRSDDDNHQLHVLTRQITQMQLDLNLLSALDALLEEGSVGGAAKRMHVTSPAMSRTLGRIRDLTGDEIFVRTGRHMTPTSFALAVRDEVHAVVLRAQAVLAQRDALDLSQLERVFTIQCHDAIASALGAPLLTRMREEAPRITLRLLAEAPTDTSDLRQGNVDLQIGATTPSHRDVAHRVLGQDRLVVAMRARHPAAGRKLTARAYAMAEPSSCLDAVASATLWMMPSLQRDSHAESPLPLRRALPRFASSARPTSSWRCPRKCAPKRSRLFVSRPCRCL